MIERFHVGISNQKGKSNGERESDGFVNALNTIRYCNTGINGQGGVYNGNVMMNSIEFVQSYGIHFYESTLGSWDNVCVLGNTLTCDPETSSTTQRGAHFSNGGRFLYRGNQSLGFGNNLSTGAAYHVYINNNSKVGIVEDNYFEDNYYFSSGNRNVGVRAFNNDHLILSRKNVFVSKNPDATQLNRQATGTGVFEKGYASQGIADMNDYLPI